MGASPSWRTRLDDCLHTLTQFSLPHHVLGLLMRALTRCRVRWWKNWQIRWFIRRYGVDTQEIHTSDPDAYPCFNAFFTRPLISGARPVADAPGEIACPVDGFVSQAGSITAGRLFQAKGRDYDLQNLLGESALAEPFYNGVFATLYLSPRDYHRVHMPLSGRLRRTVDIPGRLFSVDPQTTRTVQRLFSRNERLVTLWETEAGAMALIMVGALFVGSIETVWNPGRGRAWRSPREVRDYSDPGAAAPILAQGAELGRFNMGSTVIVLFDSSVSLERELRPEQPVRMGQRLATYPIRGL